MGRDARLTGEIIRKDIQRVIFAFFSASKTRPEPRFTPGIKTKEIPYVMQRDSLLAWTNKF